MRYQIHASNDGSTSAGVITTSPDMASEEAMQEWYGKQTVTLTDGQKALLLPEGHPGFVEPSSMEASEDSSVPSPAATEDVPATPTAPQSAVNHFAGTEPRSPNETPVFSSPIANGKGAKQISPDKLVSFAEVQEKAKKAALEQLQREQDEKVAMQKAILEIRSKKR